MSRRVLRVELDGVGSMVRGYGSRELVIEVTGRAPMWLSISRAWSVQEDTARNVVALAESRGYDIVIAGPRSAPVRAVQLETAPPIAQAPVSQPEPEVGLW